MCFIVFVLQKVTFNSILSAKRICCNFVSVKVALELMGSKVELDSFSEFIPNSCIKGYMNNCLRSQKVNSFTCYITDNVALVTKHQLKQVENSCSIPCNLSISSSLAVTFKLNVKAK